MRVAAAICGVLPIAPCTYQEQKARQADRHTDSNFLRSEIVDFCVPGSATIAVIQRPEGAPEVAGTDRRCQCATQLVHTMRQSMLACNTMRFSSPPPGTDP